MGTLTSIAWRNLGRNRRRTAITAAAVAVGVALCVATYGLTDGLGASLVHTVTKLDLGHVQIHHPEYPKRRLMRETIPDADALVKRIGELESTRGVAPRAYGWALISHGKKSTGVELVGIDPAREPGVTEFLDRMPEGQVLPESPTPWPTGRELTDEERDWDRTVTEKATNAALAELDALPSLNAVEPAAPAAQPDEEEASAPAAHFDAEAAEKATRELVRDISPPPASPPPVLLGDKLAKVIGAAVGDEVYVLSSTIDGLTAEERFRVAGVFHVGSALIDRGRAYLHIADLQRFVRLGGQVHEIAVSTFEPTEAALLADAIRALPETKELLVRSWEQVRPSLKRMLEVNDAGIAVMLFIIFVVAALGVVNTMLMAIFERTRELGVIKALGLRPGQVRRLVVLETLFLTFVGAVIGTALGLGLDAYLIWHGWDLSAYTGGLTMDGITINPVLTGALTAKGVLVPMLAMAVASFLASFYPARRAAKLSPSAAMREA